LGVKPTRERRITSRVEIEYLSILEGPLPLPSPNIDDRTRNVEARRGSLGCILHPSMFLVRRSTLWLSCSGRWSIRTPLQSMLRFAALP
jgi:hypothetical protein